jgi:hypothetical protein
MNTLASVWIVYSLMSGTLYPVPGMSEFPTSVACEEYLRSILTERTLAVFVCWPKMVEIE